MTMNDLDELIAVLENERRWLEGQIAEYISETDYWYASHHQIALEEINGKLRQCYRFKRPDYDEIERLEFMIENNKRHIATQNANFGDDFLLRYYKEELISNELRLAKLSGQKPQPIFDEQIVDNALFDLISKRLSTFRIEIIKEQHLSFIEFSLSENNEYIEIWLKGRWELDDDADDKDGHHPFWPSVNTLKGIGFNPQHGNFVFKYPNSHFRTAHSLKIILSRLFYEVIQFNARYDKAWLLLKS